MENFSGTSAPTLPAALQTSHMTTSNPGQLLPDILVQPAYQLSPGLSGRQLYSKEQWEAQKPVIYRLYNQENKPYSRVVEILRTKHNLFPTRRQFYRKISEWGFEKNIKESEMRTIAQNLENDKSGGITKLKGREINLTKIQRWQRRQERMKSVVCSFTNRPVDVLMDNELDNTNGCEPSLPNTRSSTLTPHDSTSVSPATVIESSQNLSIWTTVDLPGSPLLSRLFKALQIECPTEIPPISIGSPVAECAKTYIADVDVGEISNGKQTDDAMEQGALEANSIPGCSAVVLRKEFPPFSLRKWNLLNESFDEWAFSQWDFSKGQPFNMEISLGPLKPLSPFPILPNTAGHRPPSTSSVLSGRLQALEMEETIYRNRLDRLKRIFNENDPRIILTMSDLAIIYYKQSKHQQRERLLRHIAILTQRTYGFKHRNTLHAYVDVADALNVQGRFRQAAKIHQLVHATMPNLIAPEDELALSSAISRSDTYCGLEQDEEAEKLNRQLLQMRLITLGPKHKKTLRVMERLASSLRYANKLQESEQLLSTVLQLQYEVQDIDEDSIYYNEAKLAELFRCQGRYRESKNLALKAAERSEISLSPEHRETLHCYFQVAVCLGDLGQHAESERLLVRVLEQHVKQLGECYGSAVCAMTYLAYMLEKMGRYQEAVPFREKCFRANVENYGLEHSYSVRNCDRLGRCYETLGRYEDAFSLYQRTVDQLRGTNTDDHPAIVRISCWIAELQDIVAARQEDVCYGQDEMDANQFLSNESDSVKEEEVGGEDNSAKEGSAMNDEDWMKDFVDFRTPKEDPGHPGHPDEQV